MKEEQADEDEEDEDEDDDQLQPFRADGTICQREIIQLQRLRLPSDKFVSEAPAIK